MIDYNYFHRTTLHSNILSNPINPEMILPEVSGIDGTEFRYEVFGCCQESESVGFRQKS